MPEHHGRASGSVQPELSFALRSVASLKSVVERSISKVFMTPILATDLDGTLIPITPLPMSEQQSSLTERAALAVFRRLCDAGKLEIIFVTGRHPRSVIGAIGDEGLPMPQWILCDVGTTILHRVDDQPYHPVEAYVNHLDAIVGNFTTQHLRSCIIEHADLTAQEDEKQGRHKLSYYCDSSKLEDHIARINTQIQRSGAPYRVTSSIDPFNGDGLIDLLPFGTDKASALHWWAQYRSASLDQIVFAGDSGNDFAALTSPLRSILVGNADRKLAERVVAHHHRQNTLDRIYLATAHATAGVLEGCIRYGIVDQSAIESA